MNSLPGLLRADLLKTRHTPFLLIHLLTPLIGAGIFLAYYSFSPWSETDKAMAFMQSLACAFPTLIGLVCAMAAEQEANAGQFQGMLALPAARLTTYFSKLLVLLWFGLGAVLLAFTLFGAGFGWLLHQDSQGLPFYLTGAVITFGSNVFLYLLHLTVSLRFGRGASIGIGISGSLVAALMLTGLGDTLWPYIPFAWGARFLSLWVFGHSGGMLSPAASGLPTGVWTCIMGTIIAGLLGLLWFRRWEGRSADN
ncbi:lantibiotic immunity ABC transporter MutG family permease subunit [Paenibacillus tritici]|jgi:lantibiotic transport system permease protein|uniref:Lantibiotic immunity ABC transporter MutG family permease subunit n=1 Tax=Paenibacillus tritici TaxID=1873425 RepID=A0ABX2DQP7_9BACL|nr:lantibiotic immunity ABC transporter MutG family permease subunit [Paenibacillus tritici]NQX46487.1 lantibiotic immunity ABC transporter MutG family permease subunit [Paenibacillus tritici]QUL54863.1 lantibiotic immunity ABC transporter MutG family permease subunit [Paenibacillus tritici]